MTGLRITCWAIFHILSVVVVSSSKSGDFFFPENCGNGLKSVFLDLRLINIHFNLNTDGTHRVRYMPNVSRCAEANQKYCTKVDNYPTNEVQRLLQKFSDKYADSFVSDMLSSTISNRMNPVISDEVELCEYYEEVIYPKLGTTLNGMDAIIVNTDTHKQGIRVSKCKNAGAACKMSENFPLQYRATCKQHFVIRELLTISPNGTTVDREKFEFPACCSCALYFVN